MQTFTDFEAIISDNDPEESGRIVVESLNDPRFRYFPNMENLGMKKSFNKSLERSSSEFIIMIADDDPVYPDMLQTLYDLQLKQPGFGMYLGGCDWFCTQPEVGKLYGFNVGTNSCLSNLHEVGYVKSFQPAEFLQELFNLSIFPHYLWSTAIVKRDLLVNIGGVPEYGTPFLGDYAYMGSLGAQNGCVIINKSLGCQTLHDENFGRNQNEQIIIAATNFPTYLESKAGHLPEWPLIKKRVHRFTALWVVSHMNFLYNYYKKTGKEPRGFAQAEKEVFALPYMREYKTKYLLKKKVPAIHNLLVRIKKQWR
jgi:glycosyltransferase involved in cell wall biosynthesis